MVFRFCLILSSFIHSMCSPLAGRIFCIFSHQDFAVFLIKAAVVYIELNSFLFSLKIPKKKKKICLPKHLHRILWSQWQSFFMCVFQRKIFYNRCEKSIWSLSLASHRLTTLCESFDRHHIRHVKTLVRSFDASFFLLETIIKIPFGASFFKKHKLKHTYSHTFRY